MPPKFQRYKLPSPLKIEAALYPLNLLQHHSELYGASTEEENQRQYIFGCLIYSKFSTEYPTFSSVYEGESVNAKNGYKT
jgi:hypothetical protein